jgi:hypothetical protein
LVDHYRRDGWKGACRLRTEIPLAPFGAEAVVPPSELSSVSTYFGAHYTAPTNTSIANKWVGVSGQTVADKDQWSLRFDDAIGEKRSYGRCIYMGHG